MVNYDISSLAGLLRKTAQEELLTRFRHVERRAKADGSIVTAADIAAQNKIQHVLKQQFPDYAFLGEEMSEAEQQALLQSGKPVWCLDPLDGTSNYAAGIPYFCLSLSLIEQGEVRLGLVYDPNRDEMFTAQLGEAWLNDEPLRVRASGLTLKQSIALVDFKRLPEELRRRLIDQPPYASQRSFGSVALDWCWLAAGRVHVYLHGRANLWDYSAGQFIFQQAGGESCTLQGELVFTNALLPRSCVGAVDEKLMAEWKRFLGIG